MDITNRELLPLSTSKYANAYFAAVDHYNKDEYAETVNAAKVNLADEATPRALKIKNYILVAAASDDEDEAKEARQAAEKIWQAEKDRVEHETRALNDLRRALDELDKVEPEEEDLEMEGQPKHPKPILRGIAQYTKLFPSSTSKHPKDYFEASGHYRNDRFPETVTAARINLTDETLPLALQIKNYILISAASDNEDEAKEARQAAERIWEYAKGSIPAGPEYEYERESLEGLRAAIDECDIEEEEESDLEDEDVDMEEDESDDEGEGEEDEEEGIKLEPDAPVKESIKRSTESKSKAAD